MGLVQSAILAGSQSTWLRSQLTRRAFFQRSVSRFMPGERLDDALAACRPLQAIHIPTLLTCLGENVTNLDDARAITDHYIDAVEQIHAQGTETQLSVKLTQLGLDLGADGCFENVRRIVDHASAHNQMVWIDMEASQYVDATLDLFRRARAETPHVGICLQAYLHRTAADLDQLLPLGPAVRLVKGAYREAADVAYPRKADVDRQFMALATRLMSPDAQRAGAFVGLATHDPSMIDRLVGVTAELPADRFEFEMLYGIQAGLQRRLAAEGRRVRVLISYGSQWFPWYMRRLAERPANIWFVAKNMLRG